MIWRYLCKRFCLSGYSESYSSVYYCTPSGKISQHVVTCTEACLSQTDRARRPRLAAYVYRERLWHRSLATGGQVPASNTRTAHQLTASQGDSAVRTASLRSFATCSRPSVRGLTLVAPAGQAQTVALRRCWRERPVTHRTHFPGRRRCLLVDREKHRLRTVTHHRKRSLQPHIRCIPMMYHPHKSNVDVATVV